MKSRVVSVETQSQLYISMNPIQSKIFTLRHHWYVLEKRHYFLSVLFVRLNNTLGNIFKVSFFPTQLTFFCYEKLNTDYSAFVLVFLFHMYLQLFMSWSSEISNASADHLICRKTEKCCLRITRITTGDHSSAGNSFVTI